MTPSEVADPPELELHVPSGRSIPEALIRRAFEHLGNELVLSGGRFSVTFLEDEPIRRMNREYLRHDWVPDVLSFALHGAGDPPVADVYVGLEQAARQAGEHGVPFDEELARLALHGLLHTLGYDHPDDPDARADSEMYRFQEALLAAALGIPDSDGDPGDSPFTEGLSRSGDPRR